MLHSHSSIPRLILPLLLAISAVACNPNSLSATLNDASLPVLSSSAAGRPSDPGLYRVEVFGRTDTSDCPDCGASLDLSLDLSVAMLPTAPRNAAMIIDGTTHFAFPTGPSSPWTYHLEDADIQFTARATHTSLVHGAWLRYSCFCTRYHAEDQTLSGTLTLTSPIGASELTGTVDLTLDGGVPFYQFGLAPPLHGVVHAAFSVPAPASH